MWDWLKAAQVIHVLLAILAAIGSFILRSGLASGFRDMCTTWVGWPWRLA